MRQNISVCCLSLIVLIDFLGAKSVSDLQHFKRRLEGDMMIMAPYYSSEGNELEEKYGNTDKSVFGASEQHTWDSSDSGISALAAKENVFGRLFKDLTRTSKRSWSRYKKGGLRSCFGVRLERIGSFSGLGC